MAIKNITYQRVINLGNKELADFFENAPQPPSAKAWREFYNSQRDRWIEGDEVPPPINSIEDIDPRLRTPELERALKMKQIEFVIGNGNYSVLDVLTGHAMVIEYEVREVKRTERDYKNGETTVRRLAGDTKRIKRNRSRDTFKMRLGMGTVLEQSGDGLVEKPSGSSLCRISLWQYVLTGVETGSLPSNDLTKELINYRDSLKANVSEQGEKLLGGKHIQGKLMSKVVNLLFQELCREVLVICHWC